MSTATAALTPRTASHDFEADILVPGKRKAAIFLTTLGDEASAAILRQLTEEQVHDLTREISTLGKLTHGERQAVMKEFLATAENPAAAASGGVEYATSVLLAAFGPETGKRMAERLLRSVGTDSSNIDMLRKADAQQLAKIVQREHPQTLALILCTSIPARPRACLPNCRRNSARRWPAAWPRSTRSRPTSPTGSPKSSAPSCALSANRASNPSAASAPSPSC